MAGSFRITDEEYNQIQSRKLNPATIEPSPSGSFRLTDEDVKILGIGDQPTPTVQTPVEQPAPPPVPTMAPAEQQVVDQARRVVPQRTIPRLTQQQVEEKYGAGARLRPTPEERAGMVQRSLRGIGAPEAVSRRETPEEVQARVVTAETPRNIVPNIQIGETLSAGIEERIARGDTAAQREIIGRRQIEAAHEEANHILEHPVMGIFGSGLRNGWIGKIEKIPLLKLAPERVSNRARAEHLALKLDLIKPKTLTGKILKVAGNLLGMGPIWQTGLNPIVLMGGMDLISQTADLASGMEDTIKPESFVHSLLIGAFLKYGLPKNFEWAQKLKGGGATRRIGRNLLGTGIKAAELTTVDPIVQGVKALYSGDTEQFNESVRSSPESFAETMATFVWLDIMNLMKSGMAGEIEGKLKEYGIRPEDARKISNTLIYEPNREMAPKDLYTRLKLSFDKTTAKQFADMYKSKYYSQQPSGTQGTQPAPEQGQPKTYEGTITREEPIVETPSGLPSEYSLIKPPVSVPVGAKIVSEREGASIPAEVQPEAGIPITATRPMPPVSVPQKVKELLDNPKQSDYIINQIVTQGTVDIPELQSAIEGEVGQPTRPMEIEAPPAPVAVQPQEVPQPAEITAKQPLETIIPESVGEDTVQGEIVAPVTGKPAPAEGKAKLSPTEGGKGEMAGKEGISQFNIDKSEQPSDNYMSKGKDSIGRDIPDWKNAKVYHSTSKEGLGSISKEGFRTDLGDEQGGYYGKAISFTPQIEYTKQFGDITTVNKISPDANILNLNDPNDWETYQSIVGSHPENRTMHQQILDAGYDGVYDAGAGDLFIYNPKVVEFKGIVNRESKLSPTDGG